MKRNVLSSRSLILEDPELIRRHHVFSAIALVLILASLLAARSRWLDREPQPAVRHPLGQVLPNLQLKTLDGDPAALRDQFSVTGALIFIVSPAQCASCANLPLELRIARQQFPRVRALLIGSGATAEEFAPYIREMGIESSTLIDENRLLLGSLGLTREPVTLLCDSTGRVLFVDIRSTPQAAQYPASRVLHDIGVLLSPRDTRDR